MTVRVLFLGEGTSDDGIAELSGRRLDRFNKRFSENRRQLLQRLDTRGPVTELPSWQAFVQDVEHGLDRLGR
ncbi:hypothetical protein [Nocardiopsis sp. LOL_012]|uniref:hypothetical protein n=1 Tax=Nocardiopsis sp. LOL_012 TaxID=3345409 RepID=UPI003A8618AB